MKTLRDLMTLLDRISEASVSESLNLKCRRQARNIVRERRNELGGCDESKSVIVRISIDESLGPISAPLMTMFGSWVRRYIPEVELP